MDSRNDARNVLDNGLTYYKIGEFAKLAHVSISKLRYYDEIGLLKPYSRGKDNSYRIYDSSQLDRIATIKTFQRHGMSLQQMVQILNDKYGFFDHMADFANQKVEELCRQIDLLMQMKNEYESLALSYPLLSRELKIGQILYSPKPPYKIVRTDYFQKDFFSNGDDADFYFFMKELSETMGSVQWFASDTGYQVSLTGEEIKLDGTLLFRLPNQHPSASVTTIETIPAADTVHYIAPMSEDDIIDNLHRMLTYCEEIVRTPEDYCYVWFMVADYSDAAVNKPIIQICIPLK